MAPHQLTLLLTSTLLLALMALGLSLQLGWARGRARWPHHALFFAVCVGVLLGGALAQVAGFHGWALVLALVLLLSMPATRPGQSNHWQRALLCAGAFLVGTWLAWA